MTMTAGSAAISKDSPPVFSNILAYKDEVVPWIRKPTAMTARNRYAATYDALRLVKDI